RRLVVGLLLRWRWWRRGRGRRRGAVHHLAVQPHLESRGSVDLDERGARPGRHDFPRKGIDRIGTRELRRRTIAPFGVVGPGNFLGLGFGLGSGRCLLVVGLRFRGFRRFVRRLLLICPLRRGHLLGLTGVLLRRWLSLRFVRFRFGGSRRWIGAFRGL